MIRTVIIEDDPLSLEALKDLIVQDFSEIDILASFHTVADAVLGLKSLEFDLLLLDMELPDGRGFDVLSQLGEIQFEVIITTVHNAFMLEAIKHSAIDYLLKPVLQDDFANAMSRFKTRMSKMSPKSFPDKSAAIRSSRLVIANQQGLILTEIEDIVRLESDGAYTHIILNDGSKILASKNLGHFESELEPHAFFRVHNKHLINLEHVKNYIRGEGGQVVLSDNSSIDVSRRKKEDFLKSLGL